MRFWLLCPPLPAALTIISTLKQTRTATQNHNHKHTTDWMHILNKNKQHTHIHTACRVSMHDTETHQKMSGLFVPLTIRRTKRLPYRSCIFFVTMPSHLDWDVQLPEPTHSLRSWVQCSTDYSKCAILWSVGKAYLYDYTHYSTISLSL